MLLIQKLPEWLGEKISLVMYLFFARVLAKFCFKSIGRLEVQGSELLPTTGPYILASNHLSFNDSIALVASIPHRLHFISKKDYTKIPFIDWIIGIALKTVGIYTYNRQGIGGDPLRQIRKWLAQGDVVVIFPEGTRSKAHTMQRGKAGVVLSAMSSGVTIVPLGICGTEKFPAWLMLFPFRRRMQVKIGKPFKLPNIKGTITKRQRELLLKIVMLQIAKLLPEKYQGVWQIPEAS
ncbi:MAG: lysophospholipid acyltransferase family protein [bacterium]|nr:lysophospholipid acyltransferase family protein [bacterium]